MVDTRDLKSLGHYGCTSSSLVSGTSLLLDFQQEGFFCGYAVRALDVLALFVVQPVLSPSKDTRLLPSPYTYRGRKERKKRINEEKVHFFLFM